MNTESPPRHDPHDDIRLWALAGGHPGKTDVRWRRGPDWESDVGRFPLPDSAYPVRLTQINDWTSSRKFKCSRARQSYESGGPECELLSTPAKPGSIPDTWVTPLSGRTTRQS